MPKRDRKLKFQDMPAGMVSRSAVHGAQSMVHNSLSGRGLDDCHSQYVLHDEAYASCRVYNSANISVANNSWQALTFDTERWDTDDIHSTTTNTERLTCATAGTYLITGHISFAANVAGNRGAGIRLGGTTYIATHLGLGGFAVNNTNITIVTMYQLAADEYVELMVYQNSGGALNVELKANHSPEFGMVRIGGS